MVNRFIAALVATLVAGCIVAPAALAAGHKTTSSAAAGGIVATLSAVKTVRIGMNSTVVTIQNGAKAHPIVIDYGAMLKTGVMAVNNDGSTSRIANGDAPITSPLPKSLSVGQIAAWLLGLTLVSRVIGVAKQLVPSRIRR